MSYRKKVDDNHQEIKKMYEDFYFSTFSVHIVPKFVDLIVARNMVNVLVEVKGEDKELKKHQSDLQKIWRGPIHTIRNRYDIVEQWYKLTGEQLIIF